jgi:hypothetical protein
VGQTELVWPDLLLAPELSFFEGVDCLWQFVACVWELCSPVEAATVPSYLGKCHFRYVCN